MKNKNFIIIFITLVISLLQLNLSNAEEFTFESSEIQFFNKGNLIKGTKNAIIKTSEIEIRADSFEYDKKKLVLKANKNILINDFKNKVKINANIILYNKNEEKIYINGKLSALVDEKIKINSKNIVYDRVSKKITSKESTIVQDYSKNIFSVNKFIFSIKDQLLQGENIKLTDNQKNKYSIEQGMVKFKTGEVLGKDISINFNNSILGNEDNEPRLKANTIFTNDEFSKVSKGVFTTCKKRDGCPPWVISAEEIEHDKKKKVLNYKNAWLQIYDYPVVYFPKFFHPDPTVKRQSGFLIPSLLNTKNLGTSITIPYYNVLADNKDIASVEITPQHLTLAAPDCYNELGSYAQMNPPIRDINHQTRLWTAINNGVADIIGSDHAPHTKDEKDKEYPISPSGMPGVQTLVPVMLNHVNNEKLSLNRFVQLTSANPARLFGIKNKGFIEVGNDADFTVIDLNKERVIENNWIVSKCGWTPYDGMRIKGWPIMTIIRGNIVMREDELSDPIGQPMQFNR